MKAPPTTPKATTERDQTQVSWDRIAAGFDEFVTPFSMEWAQDALRRIDLRPGMRFLDVAAGSGALSIPAARLGADVVAVDISPTMIERLSARAREAGFLSIETYVMDGQALELPDDTFDVSASLNGVSLFPDLPQGLRELARVTKPGGRAVILAFGQPHKAEWLGLFMSAMQASVPGFTGLPMDPPPLPFQVADPNKLRERMAEAGLKDVLVETVTFTMECQTATQLWDTVTNSNPIGAMLIADLSREQRVKVEQVLDGMLRERFENNSTAVLHTDINIGIGVK